MVVGMITITTCYGVATIPVELLGKGSHPGMARVKALGGLQPFTKISHGGPYQDDTLVVPLPFVRNIHLEKNPDEERGEEVAKEPNIPARDWFLESAYEDRTVGE